MIRNCIITALTVSLLLVSTFAYALFTGRIVQGTQLTADQIAIVEKTALWDGK